LRDGIGNEDFGRSHGSINFQVSAAFSKMSF
jgi:hypothetical protein